MALITIDLTSCALTGHLTFSYSPVCYVCSVMSNVQPVSQIYYTNMHHIIYFHFILGMMGEGAQNSSIHK